VPDRNDIVWLDFEPPRGKEIGKYRPALVLSSRTYNRRTGLLICCPISTSIRGAPTEVPVGNLDRPSVVVRTWSTPRLMPGVAKAARAAVCWTMSSCG
jgi:mRNA interferase MazF